MKLYSLRITQQYVKDEQSMIEYLDASCSRYVFFEEIGAKNQKVHYQGWIETDSGDSTFRRNIGKLLSEKGQKAYSLSPAKDPEALYCYVVKDGKQRFVKGVSNEELEEWKAKSDSRHAKEVKPSSKTIIQVIEEEVIYIPTMSAVDYAVRVYDWYVTRGKILPDRYMLKNIIQTIIIRNERRISRSNYDRYIRQFCTTCLFGGEEPKLFSPL